MFISKRGTVMNVAEDITRTYGGRSTSITDGIDGGDGSNTSETNASTGTVIAYSEGIWEQATHQLGSKGSLPTTAITDSR